MIGLVVERPGLLTTVQDPGRRGLQHLGVPVSGWMDDWSARLANRLVGNVEGHAVLEVTWSGPVLRVERPARLAVTGAVFDLQIDDRIVRSPAVFTVDAGSRLMFGQRHRGARAYLAVAGGIDVPEVLGSRATDLRVGLGGLDGRRLKAGDQIHIGEAAVAKAAVTELPAPPWVGSVELRVLEVEGDDGSRESFVALCQARYRLAAASNRVGYRLESDRPLPATAASILSRPVVMGAVQVPPDGSPVLLMADRQTTGGYVVPAIVASADLPVAGQLGPGDACQFVPCTVEEARRAARERSMALDAMTRQVR